MIDLRRRHRQALERQMAHQFKVERQLRRGETLEQREHPAAAAGRHEIVGVLDPGRDRLEALDLAQRVMRQQAGHIVER